MAKKAKAKKRARFSGAETGPIMIKEPKSSGGGTSVRCPPGYYISGIQPGRDPDGQR